jgi:type II secretory ATPase GspE/PulE/Tfp pilus assembly ATPase PilB-like protein
MAGSDNMRRSLESVEQLNSIFQRITKADTLGDIIWALEQEILRLLNADRMTIYRRDPSGREILSWYRTADDTNEEIRLPMSPSSIAGFVAMSHQPLKIDDVYDQEMLQSIHPNLNFDYSFDQSTGYLTESMIVVPIKFKDTLLGVLQIINRVGGGPFADQDVIHALAIAQMIADKFRNELKTTTGPYEYLIQLGRLSLDQFEAYENQAEAEGKSLVKLLIKKAKVPMEEIGASLSSFYQVPFLGYDENLKPDKALLDRLNVSYLTKNLWVPFTGAEGEVVVLLDDPNDTDRIMEIQYLLNASAYDFRVGLKEDILHYLGIVVDDQDDKEINLESLAAKLEEESLAKIQVQEDVAGSEGPVEDELDENASPIVQLVNRMIVEAAEMNASDIHIEPAKGKTPAMVRMRIDGICRNVLQVPHTHIRALISRIKVLARLDIAERRLPQDGKMVVRVNGKPVELRVATLPTVNGESAVLRILAAGEPLPFEKLNFSERNEEVVKKCMDYPHGIFLVVGPTGSGKTTTLHGLLNYLNTPDNKILTAEDPVEITQNGLSQVQMQKNIGLDFARALRAFLRCDPDIILIGEMRDHETAHAGIEASLTGHLVFSTLHTNSAPETVTRLLDMGLDPLNFADAFVGVMAQRLIRTLCKDCKQPGRPSDEVAETLRLAYGEKFWPELKINPAEMVIYTPKGCPKCGGSGYRGRTGVHELMAASPEIKKLISKRATVTEVREVALAEGMRTIRQDGVLKILKGMTDYEQLRQVAAE